MQRPELLFRAWAGFQKEDFCGLVWVGEEQGLGRVSPGRGGRFRRHSVCWGSRTGFAFPDGKGEAENVMVGGG